MTSHIHHEAHAAPMLRWVLQQESATITCRLDARGSRSYEVCILPHWDPSAALIEHFDTLTEALLSHADVGARLRGQGWSVIDHVSDGGVHAAAGSQAPPIGGAGPGRPGGGANGGP